MRWFSFLFITFLLSCSVPGTDKIVIPHLESGTYAQLFERINDDLKADPTNERLIDQKLYYCEQLDWPETCISALDVYKSQHAMTYQLVLNYVKCYQRHRRYQSLFDVINQWEKKFELEDELLKPKITSLVNLSQYEEANELLGIYMINKSKLPDIEFAATQYLRVYDTLKATYYLSELNKLVDDHPLLENYADILISLGYEEIGVSILELYAKNHPTDVAFHKRLATVYGELGDLRNARRFLIPYANNDTINYQIANWYQQDGLWDSAFYFIDQVIARDSTNKTAWWKKGRMYEDRGWLNYSLRFFNHLITLDSSDIKTRDRIAIIQRKITYLRHLKFEKNKIPLRNLESKKIKNE